MSGQFGYLTVEPCLEFLDRYLAVRNAIAISGTRQTLQKGIDENPMAKLAEFRGELFRSALGKDNKTGAAGKLGNRSLLGGPAKCEDLDSPARFAAIDDQDLFPGRNGRTPAECSSLSLMTP